jgi:hypothetical protein
MQCEELSIENTNKSCAQRSKGAKGDFFLDLCDSASLREIIVKLPIASLCISASLRETPPLCLCVKYSPSRETLYHMIFV